MYALNYIIEDTCMWYPRSLDSYLLAHLNWTLTVFPPVSIHSTSWCSGAQNPSNLFRMLLDRKFNNSNYFLYSFSFRQSLPRHQPNRLLYLQEKRNPPLTPPPRANLPQCLSFQLLYQAMRRRKFEWKNIICPGKESTRMQIVIRYYFLKIWVLITNITKEKNQVPISWNRPLVTPTCHHSLQRF